MFNHYRNEDIRAELERKGEDPHISPSLTSQFAQEAATELVYDDAVSGDEAEDADKDIDNGECP